jgi:hypothetical protein
LGRVWASQAQGNAMFGKERAGRSIVELLPVVCLKALNGTLKLRANKGMKRHKSRQNIRFVTQRESPHIMVKIIKNDKVKFVSRIAQNWGGPNITMQ